MTTPRLRAVTVISGLALAAVYGLVPTQAASAKPDVKDTQAKVNALYRQAEVASERYNDAKLQLTKLKSETGALHADETRQATALDTVREDAKSSILRQYTGSDLGAVSQVIGAGDPGKFLSQISTVSSYDRIQSGLMGRYQTSLKALSIRREATSSRLAQVASTEKQLASDKADVDDKLADAKDLLGRLQDQQRAELASADSAADSANVPAAADVPVSGRAAAAVHYALAQVGKAYVYGAAGPSAFDCSGLVMMAWAQAGVALPHSSSAQYGTGPHIAESDLQPGDLVFYYSPISHVGMYIGNGLIVNAENPSVGVKVIPLHELPYVGAVRPG